MRAGCRGIVSATERSPPDGNCVRFIETDVALSPGNSGGPLLNRRGTGGYMGLPAVLLAPSS